MQRWGLTARETSADGYTHPAPPTVPTSIAVEYGPHGIRCNCVCPSTIRSSLIEPYLQDENAKKMLESTFPLRRIGEPDDIAGAVSYLCSDDARWVTGSVMMIDGGVTARQ